VTLVGPGGVGKTRLATVVARELSQREEHRVAWVDLASVTSPADVAPLTVECLGLTSPDRAAPATAASALARFPGLVVLDNCEHVLEAVAEMVALVLTCDNRARMLATSRERLDVAGEQVVLVTPLPIPHPHAASEQDPAVRLFQERLAATDAGTVTAAGRRPCPSTNSSIASASISTSSPVRRVVMGSATGP
jgi:predicted ATPase